MLKILTVIFCFFVAARGYDYPGRYKHENTASTWQHRHTHNMTENIIKDALYKLRHADVVQSAYKDASSYELGMIQEGIMAHWKHMIRVYKYYSNAKDFKNHTHTITQIMNGYAVIQSDYNEIVHETVLLHEIVKKHQKQQRAEMRRIKKIAVQYRIPLDLALYMVKTGMDVDKAFGIGLRRIMSKQDINDTFLGTGDMKDEAVSRKMNGNVKEIEIADYEFPKDKSFNEWVKKDANNTEEAEYKKSLRYKTWAEKWDGFNPDIEGIHIPDKIANMGLKNASDFFLTELKEDFL